MTGVVGSDISKSSRGVRLDGVALRALRKELSLTQSDVAELAGVTTRTYQTAERGQRVSAQSARNICVALGSPFASLRRYSSEQVRERLESAGYGSLPPPSPWGVRDDESSAIFESLGRPWPGGVVCCLTGPSGIGKTGLVRHSIAALAQWFPDGVVWVNASLTETDDTATATMMNIAQELGFAVRMPDPRIVAPDAFHQAFRRNLRSRRRLLVLDDVASASHARRFLGQDEPGWALVTTMFHSVGAELGDPLIEVGPLSVDASRQLLEAHIGSERAAEDQEGLRRLVELLGGIPRTIQIAGRALHKERLTRLSDYADRIAALSDGGADTRCFRDDESFANAYLQLRDRLSEAGWRFFGGLSVFGDSPFVTRWAAAAVQRPTTDVRALLSDLTDLYLVQEVSVGAPTAVGSRWFVMDAQAQRVARTIDVSNAPVVTQRLLSYAKDQALRIGGLELAEGVRAFQERLHLFKRCFDLATGAVLPSGVAQVLTAPDEVPHVDEATLREFELLPGILSPLRAVLHVHPMPEARSWISAGLTVAAHTGQRLAFGRLAAMMAHEWMTNAADFPRIMAFYVAAKEALVEQGALEEAFSASFYAACAVLSSGGPLAALPRFEEILAWARQGELRSTSVAISLQAVAFSLAMMPRDESDWRRAKALLEEVPSYCKQEGSPAEAIMRSASLVSLAVMHRLDGSAPPRGDIEGALAPLVDLVGDDALEVWRLERIGQLLGLTRWDGLEPISVRRQREILLGVSPEGVPNRIVKLLSFIWIADLSERLHERPGFSEGMEVRVGIAELVTGSHLEIELGHVIGVLYPAELARELLDETGSALARTFVAETCGADHPSLNILDHLVGPRNRLE